MILVRWILLVREDDRIPTGKARDIVDVAMSIVPRRAFTQPYSIGDAQVLGEGLLVVLSAHAGVSHLDVREQPLLDHQHHSAAVDLDSSPLQHQPLAIVLSFCFRARQSGDAGDHPSDIGVLTIVIVLRPAVEAPVDPLDFPVGAQNACRCRVSHPHPVVGRDVQAILLRLIHHAMRRQQKTSVRRHRVVMAKDFDSLELTERPHDLGVYPWNRRQLSGPVGLVMRPGNPGRFVPFPFSGHPSSERQLHSQSAASLWSGALALQRRAALRHPM